MKNYLKHRRKRVYTAIGCVFILAICFSGIRLLRFTSETAEAQTLKTAVAVELITSEDVPDTKHYFQRIKSKMENLIESTPNLRFRVHNGEIPKWKIYLIFADNGDTDSMSITLTRPTAAGEILVMNHLSSVVSLPDSAPPKVVNTHIAEVNISLKLVINVIQTKEKAQSIDIIENRFSTTLILD